MSRIRMVSRWENSQHNLFVGNARQIKAIWLRHGAEDFSVARIHTGQDTGKYEVAINFAGWEAFGRATERVSKDEEFSKMIAASHDNGRMIARNLIVEINLD
jgi:hypothetical protein